MSTHTLPGHKAAARRAADWQNAHLESGGGTTVLLITPSPLLSQRFFPYAQHTSVIFYLRWGPRLGLSVWTHNGTLCGGWTCVANRKNASRAGTQRYVRDILR